MLSAPLASLYLLRCAVIVCLAGARRTRDGDVIAETTGIGGTWAGLMLPASVNSLWVASMARVVVIGAVRRPHERLPDAANWLSLMLFSIYLVNTWLVFLQSE